MYNNKKNKINNIFNHKLKIIFLSIKKKICILIFKLFQIIIFPKIKYIHIDTELLKNNKIKNINLKNCVQMSVVNYEIPNIYYTFNRFYKNISFMLIFKCDNNYIKKTVCINEGNYDNCSIIEQINDKFDEINNNYKTQFNIIFNEINGRTILTNNSTFMIDFNNNSIYNSLGYILGFRKNNYKNNLMYYSESMVNVVGDNYLFLKINNYKNKYSPEYIINYITKIILNVNKYNICFNNNIKNNSLFYNTKKIHHLSFSLVDKYNNIINFKNMHYSFTLKLEYF